MPSKTPSSGPADWLLGRWRSDKGLTVDGWGKHPPGSIEFQAIMLRTLGKTELLFTPKRFTSMFEDAKSVTPYRVIWKSETSMVVVFGRIGEETAQHLHFLSPTLYWIHTGRFWEYFSKMK